MTPTFLTVDTRTRVEIPKIKGSRFIADLAPATAAPDSEAVLADIRNEFSDARHHCYAWRLGRDGDEFRYSDDGEPSGTAGRPILQHLEGARVTNVVLVVTRYFGGTKLGAGGLIRAYGGAAAAALDAATIREVVITRRVEVRHGYDNSPALKSFIHARGIEPVLSDYGEQILTVFDVPQNEVTAFVNELRDRTAGRATIDVIEP